MMIAFFIAIGVLLVLGFLFGIISAILNMTFDIITPEISSIGNIGSANMTEISSMSIDPLNTVIQSFTWFSGVCYILIIIGLLGIAFSVRLSTSKWLIAMFFLLAILMLLASIILSNTYQDLYEDDGELGSILHEHILLSYLILNSPLIFTVIIFVSGIILFSGLGGSDGYA